MYDQNNTGFHPIVSKTSCPSLSSPAALLTLAGLAGGIGGWGAVHEEFPFISGGELTEAFIIGMAWSLAIATTILLAAALIQRFTRR